MAVAAQCGGTGAEVRGTGPVAGADSTRGGASAPPPAAAAAQTGLALVRAAPPPSAQPAVHPLAPSAHLFTTRTAPSAAAAVRVIRDQVTWEAVWRELQAGSDVVSTPAVDFAREMVVMVAAGQKPSGGHAVYVDGTSQGADGGLVLHVTETAPGTGCMSTMALTSPVDVVRVARATGEVRVAARRAAAPC